MNEQIIDAEIVSDNLPAVRASQAIVARDEITVDDLVAQADKVKQAMQRAMKPDVHYGRIPGVNKPTLLKPGAETLCVLLRLAPSYESERIWHDDGHLTVVSRARLQHIPTGYTVAEGEGLCSSREAKYAYRNADRTCPKCGQPAIIKGKAQFGGGWVCFKKKGGCGAKYADADPAIVGQATGRVDNPDLPDTFNTVLKMANKRALVAAVLNGTAASDIFTQDVEDGGEVAADEPRSSAPPREVQDEPADIALWQTADRLLDELYKAAESIGADPAVALDHATRHRQAHADDPEEHVRWLMEQLARVRERASDPGSQFQPPASARGELADHRRIMIRARELGVSDEVRYRVTEAVTGQRSSKAVRRDQVEAVLAGLEQAALRGEAA